MQLSANSTNLRVHISPVGYDPVLRVMDPLIKFKADRVYLVTLRKDDSAAKQFKKVKDLLEAQKSIETKEVYTNIWDLFSCLEKYREIFEKEEDNHVYVNVSTGSKIVSIAGMLACMLWNGTPYYTKLDYSDGNDDENQSKLSAKATERKVTTTEFLPVYEITKPTAEAMKVLSVMNQSGGKIGKKALIEILQSKDYQMIPQFSPSQTKSAPHSRLRAILDPLEKHWRFVTIKAKGRQSEVRLTEQARNALKIFGSG
jgi:CRISPR locus-related DNA-binding protein